MSRILDKHEVYTMPLDKIIGINRIWRDGIKLHDPKWEFVLSKHTEYDINKYIINNYPELREQFEWEQMSGNERMNRKFGHVKTSVPTNHYVGEYSSPRYDADLDPFFDQE